MSDRYIKQGFIKLDNIVVDLIMDLRLTTLHRYVYYLHYMIGGYQRFLMSTIPITQTKRLKINAAKMIDYPMDMIGLILAGIPAGDRIIPLLPNSSIARVDADDTPYVAKAPDGRTRFSQDIGYWGAQQLDTQVPSKGQGHNNAGYYNNNISKRRIELSVDTSLSEGDTVFIEYVADGCGDMSNATMIYAPAANMLKQWAHYRWSLFKFGANNNETRAQYQLFKEERDEYKSITSNLTKDVIIAAINQTAHVGPKL